MIVEEVFLGNHVRRYSDKNVKIQNMKDGMNYDIAEDWSDEWFVEHNLTSPTYTETEIPIEKEVENGNNIKE